jgi:hypothetical protein
MPKLKGSNLVEDIVAAFRTKNDGIVEELSDPSKNRSQENTYSIHWMDPSVER